MALRKKNLSVPDILVNDSANIWRKGKIIIEINDNIERITRC